MDGISGRKEGSIPGNPKRILSGKSEKRNSGQTQEQDCGLTLSRVTSEKSVSDDHEKMVSGTPREPGTRRDPALDVFRGMLVLQMVLCHCIQFFGDDGAFVQKQICDYINLTTFSGFVLAFGFACQYAYFCKSFRKAAPRMLRTALKCLIAFYLSSICYVALQEYDYYDPRVVRQILLLQKYAGWSEFLASFFGLLLAAILLFPVFQRMNGYLAAAAGVLSLALTFLPYEEIRHPWAALFAGSADYTTFPVLQYLLYFAAGVFLCRQKNATGAPSDDKTKRVIKWALPGLALVLSLPEILYYAGTGYLSMRFPPDWRYISGAAVFLYLYLLLAGWLSGGKNGKRRIVRPAVSVVLRTIGENALFYLLFSNVVIFGFAAGKFRQWNIKYAIKFYVLLMLSAWFCQHLVRNGRRRNEGKGQTAALQTEK